jgi:hypothetical protein
MKNTLTTARGSSSAFLLHRGGQRYVNYVEPMIKIEYKNIIPDAFLDNSLTARWGYEPVPVKEFAFKTAGLFPPDDAAFGSDCSILSANTIEHYTRTQKLMKDVMSMAHARGMQTAMGELAFTA